MSNSKAPPPPQSLAGARSAPAPPPWEQGRGPDFSYWATIDYWTLAEAVALSVGHNPELLTPRAAQRYPREEVAREYSRRMVLVDRAEGLADWRDFVRPCDFVAWATRKRIELPLPLTAALVHPAPTVSREGPSLGSPKGRARCDRLALEIKAVLNAKPDCDAKALLDELAKRKGNSVIVGASASTIVWLDQSNGRKTTSLPNLRERLRRLTKK